MTNTDIKKRIQISIPKSKYRELKVLGIDKGKTISELLLKASETLQTNEKKEL